MQDFTLFLDFFFGLVSNWKAPVTNILSNVIDFMMDASKKNGPVSGEAHCRKRVNVIVYDDVFLKNWISPTL